ncbi:MAG: ATP synthase subunit I [Chloroflexaceae bacterium]|nr:ATP synthase subunit I [Chloroflexaceae bacterium]
MSNTMGMLLAGAAGMAMGLAYFGGLWLTVQRLPRSRHPALLLVGSFALRMALLLVGLYAVMGGQWQRALAGVAGLLLARVVLTHRLRPDPCAAERSERP